MPRMSWLCAREYLSAVRIINHRRFRALDNPETGASEVCVTSAKLYEVEKESEILQAIQVSQSGVCPRGSEAEPCPT